MRGEDEYSRTRNNSQGPPYVGTNKGIHVADHDPRGHEEHHSNSWGKIRMKYFFEPYHREKDLDQSIEEVHRVSLTTTESGIGGIQS
jgi:hypothetical protein